MTLPRTVPCSRLNLNARYYDPVLGLFLQPDWFEVLRPGVGTNRFSYSFNDPVNKLDPMGNYATYEGTKTQGLSQSKRNKPTQSNSSTSSNPNLSSSNKTGTTADDNTVRRIDRRYADVLLDEQCGDANGCPPFVSPGGGYPSAGPQGPGGPSGGGDPLKRGNRVAETIPPAPGPYTVYQGVDDFGRVLYYGITRQGVSVRAAQHLASNTARSLLQYTPVRGMQGLSQIQARIFEQNLINGRGLGSLVNKINSIAPRFWQQYGVLP